MAIDFDAYVRALAQTPVEAKTEHTDRGALERLLNEAAASADTRLRVQHEPKGDKSGGGRPDYMVKRDARIAGYVEVKTVDEALEKVRRSAQIKKYQTLSDNLLLTDYLEFVWLKGSEVQRARLAHSDAIAPGRRLAVDPDRAAEVSALLRGFFSTAPQSIGRGKDLAVELAARAALLRDALAAELNRQQRQNDQGRLFGLLETFRTQIFHDLTVEGFADAFAQMLAYGLFLARLNAGDTEQVRLDNVRRFIPGSFSLIRELVRFLDELNEDEYRPSRWVVEEILSIVNGIDLAAIQQDLSFRNRKAVSRKVRAGDEDEHRLFEKDPFIYFYEDFLKAYDPRMRKGRGVYYTPPPVVNFIVRAIDDILKDSFGIGDGLADHRRVTVLDFACGTGTFILEVFERIFDTIGGADAGRADSLVREHLTRNIYGFEYLIAPYTIAHLKLSQYLKDKGHPLGDDERLQVFLTNTLEPVEPQGNLLMPALAEEVKGAQAVKDKPILVITGNPPYSGHSKNTGAWITASIAEYRKGFPELSKPAQGKWLQDDYVKFIRFAQMKMEDVDEGIVGIITNHSWLDNPTFKGMRKSLMGTFDQIYVLDLHGNAKRQEKSPDGSKDENVFDIEQGVSVSIFVKRSDVGKAVFHADLWGRRLYKYTAVANAALTKTAWKTVAPQTPDWLFRPQDNEAANLYRTHPSVPEIFGRIGDPAPGIVTTHDQFAISFSATDALNKVKSLLATDTESEARKIFKLCSQSQWSYDKAKVELPISDVASAVQRVTYRPFDDRWTIWDKNVVVHRRDRAMKHMQMGSIGLVFVRQISHANQDRSVYALATDAPIDNRTFVSAKGIAFVEPLYLDGSLENLTPAFRDFIDARYAHHYDPEDILGYIYAVLHAPTYRRRYAEFLRIDFPRIPFADDRAAFERLSALGWGLIQVHLLREKPRSNPRLGDYAGRGDHTVEAVRYSPDERTIWINRTQGFTHVPQAVWDFHIGGYQVLDKYLKSRKGRSLSLDEQTHVGETAEALNFTIAQMQAIDAAYGAAFPEQGGG